MGMGKTRNLDLLQGERANRLHSDDNGPLPKVHGGPGPGTRHHIVWGAKAAPQGMMISRRKTEQISLIQGKTAQHNVGRATIQIWGIMRGETPGEGE